MDPLQPPLISKYEWEYKNDINQRMRVPDKLSVATSLPNLESAERHDSGSGARENLTVSSEHRETTPGYSPDLLTDSEVQPDASTEKVPGNDAVDASAMVCHNARVNSSVSPRFAVERLRVAEHRLNHLEILVTRLSSRLRTLEQQQAILGGLISVYFGLKIVRFLLSGLFK
ncbi:hypothetical protein Aperf_G00000108037 [Anoplocephala perfoliata]